MPVYNDLHSWMYSNFTNPFMYYWLIGGAAPRYAVEPMTDLLLVLNKKYCDNLARWLNNYLSQDGFPSPKITKEQKEVFIKTVLR